ncbi:MAG: protein TolQ [Rhodospirillaceae bacterium]|jgi:biopolymer transport protein TolQ|nr:protein TolQ [Rhodospirillaceae bacterium]
MDPVQTVTIAHQITNDLSMWNLFIRADIIVKTVIAILSIVSIWCWAIIFDKWFRLRRLVRRTNQFEENFWASGGTLEELYDRIGSRPPDPMSSIFCAAMREWRRSDAKSLTNREIVNLSLPQRIDRIMSVILGREIEHLDARMGFLASVGSTAPFIGLFGTVWGIMNSFYHIGASKNTSLAVVAPGIAEALFATALGLVAAIPAVLAYNKLSTDIDRYAKRLEAFVGEFGAVLSRKFDEKA